jgi:GT2 family glycosyltransferase
MKSINIDRNALFERTPDFHLKRDDNGFFLENKSTGGIIEIDKTGDQILNLLPGSIQSVIDRLTGTNDKTEERLIKFYFYLFNQVGIINQPGHRDKNNRDKNKPGIPPTVEKKERDPNQGIKISIIIVTLNSERFILKNLASLYNQTLLPEEIIITDNGSTDDTLPSVRKHFPGVHIIENNANLHYAKAVNIGVEKASGNLMVILNDDIELEPDFIQKTCLQYLESENKENIAAISPVIRFNKLRSCVNSVGNVILKGNWGMDNYMGAVDIGQFERIKILSSVCFGAVTVTRQGWERVGQMDDGFKFYDDIDWCFRAHMKGMDIRFNSGIIAYHEFGGTYPTGMKLTFIVKSRMRFVLKNYPCKTMLSFMFSYLYRDIRDSLYFLKKGEFNNFLSCIKGYWLLLLEIPGLAAYRLKHRGVTEADIHEFNKKTPPLKILVNDNNHPLITAEVIENYYSTLSFNTPGELA